MGNFQTEGDITFGVAALEGVKITSLTGDIQTKVFHATIQAADAVTKLAQKLPNVDLKATATTAVIDWNPGAGGLSMNGKIDGSVKFPKSGASELEGEFHATLNSRTGFTGSIDKVKITANDYFKSANGTADMETGEVNLGEASFEIPGVVKGKVKKTDVNLKTGKFHIDVDADAQGALQGLKLNVTVENQSITASLLATSPQIPLGTFGSMTFAGGTTMSLVGGKLSGHLGGTIDAPGLGKGTFTMDAAAGGMSGTANVHVEQFAVFEATDIALTINAQGKVNTTDAVTLKLASRYATMLEAQAGIQIKDNVFGVAGAVTQLKNLGKVSEAFKHADITWNQGSKDIQASTEFSLGGSVIPELAASSMLKFEYANKEFAISGTLVPASFPPVTFSAGSEIKASWTSATNQFVVEGGASAEIADIGGADLTVDSSVGRGQPGSFKLNGKINPTKMAQTFPGITFSNVQADFSVEIGTGHRPDLAFDFTASVTGIPAAGVSDMASQITAKYHSGEGLSGTMAITRAKLGDVTADGSLTLSRGKFQAGSLHLAADFPGLQVDGTATVTASDMGAMSATAELKVTPGGGSALAQFVQSGSVHVDVMRWKLTQVEGSLNLKPPSFLPLEDTVVKIGYAPGVGISATLSTHFAAPMAKNGEKGTFTAGYTRGRGFFAHIEFPVTVPGFQAATVAGDLDGAGIRVSATLVPK
ncbi:MAG TPA: hypothetical protein VGC42_31760, partial [Kofleriaceae bacterium]